MVNYEKIFEPYYEGGWEAYPLETTLITAGALNDYDAAFMHIEDYLANQIDPNDNLAETYSDEDTYEAGEYRIYNGVLYKCLEDIDEAEEFDPTKWESCLVTDEMATSGGTTVIANPVGTPTDDLETIQIGETIYDIPGGGGGTANIWTGTLAEYEAQASQIADGTQVNITDDEQEVVEGGTIYSEDEQCIGLWLDNKPLYQKTLVYNKTNIQGNTTFDITSDLTDIETIYDFKSSIDYSVGSATATEYADNYAVLTKDGSSYKIKLAIGGTTLTTADITITIQYTKTTDAPIDAVVGKRTMYIASSDCYSTEEKEVGVWHNGKPIYQRSFDLGTDLQIAYNAFTNTTIDATDMDTIINVKGIYSTGATIYNLMATKANNIIALQSDRNNTGANVRFVVLQYTKTSDTAGSGSYTPASGKAVHYSTDEQVIGTYVDGKPIYRKSFTYDSGSLSSGTLTLANGLSNVERVIDKHSQFHSGSDNRDYDIPYFRTDYNESVFLLCHVLTDNTVTTALISNDHSSYNNMTNIVVTLEYTKTTD